MKSKLKTRSIIDNVVKPLPHLDINKIFFEKEKSSTEYTKDSLMYQDILRYAMRHQYKEGFRFSDLANWLIRNNCEFIDFYTGNKSHTTYSARLSNRRQQIQSHIDNMVRLRLLREKGLVNQQKNTKEKTPMYDFTQEGYLLAALAQPDDERVLKILEHYSSINNSSILLFMTKFFRKEFERGEFYSIVGYLTHNILPKYPLANGHDLLKIIFAVSTCLNWIIIFPETFRETLSELQEDMRKFVLFQFKIEIEEYYRQYYLVNEFMTMEVNKGDVLHDHHKISIPENEWERIRFQNIGDFFKITVPGYCSRCNSVSIFAVDVMRYLDWIIGAHRPYPEWIASGKCDKCGIDYGASAHVMRLPHLTSAWL